MQLNINGLYNNLEETTTKNKNILKNNKSPKK